MAPEISLELKELIVKWYNDPDDERTMQQIADLADVSIGLVSKTINLHRTYGQVTNPFGRRPGHPYGSSTLNDGDLAYLTEILRVNNTLYLDELQSKLATVRD
ncbi:hypothetical protein B0H11DRAFT_1663362, partial [Mycena galericulata]